MKEIYFDKQGKRGRPKLILNDNGKQAILDLAKIQCTEEEIAGFLDVCVETLKTKENEPIFLDCLKKGKANGKKSLRRIQFDIAESGNATMAIWLGKQYLGQKEIPETTDEDDVIIFKNDIPKVD